MKSYMAKKTSNAKQKKAVKSTSKPAAKPVAKASAKPAAKSAAKAAKPVAAAKTQDKKAVSKKAAEKPEPKAKPTHVASSAKKNSENNEKGKGATLIEMAKNEMSAIKIGQVEESKVEKAGKLKPIKVERGDLADEKAKWIELNKRYSKEKALNYKMSEVFEALRPIQHKVLGWGFILTNEDDRLEVLFENGIKMLISNYKPN